MYFGSWFKKEYTSSQEGGCGYRGLRCLSKSVCCQQVGDRQEVRPDWKTSRPTPPVTHFFQRGFTSSRFPSPPTWHHWLGTKCFKHVSLWWGWGGRISQSNHRPFLWGFLDIFGCCDKMWAMWFRGKRMEFKVRLTQIQVRLGKLSQGCRWMLFFRCSMGAAASLSEYVTGIKARWRVQSREHALLVGPLQICCRSSRSSCFLTSGVATSTAGSL